MEFINLPIEIISHILSFCPDHNLIKVNELFHTLIVNRYHPKIENKMESEYWKTLMSYKEELQALYDEYQKKSCSYNDPEMIIVERQWTTLVEIVYHFYGEKLFEQ
uniref:F-box domain-containing protein n=1 Tax=viral metagenome TaxID=1070528 RepID=A0A6C0LVV1_9ZZZZ